MKFIIAFIASAALFDLVSAVCDNTTAAKIQECVFTSDLFDPAKIPQNEAAVNNYCNGNATIDCLTTTMGECNDDERQLKLMQSLATVQRVVDGEMYLCQNQSALVENWDCLTDFNSQAFQDCVKEAVGKITNTATDQDLKARLDNMCMFFGAYSQCFEGEGITENCKDVAKTTVQMAVNGISYAYCSMNDEGKKGVIDNYNSVGASSALTASLVTVFIAYLISVFN